MNSENLNNNSSVDFKDFIKEIEKIFEIRLRPNEMKRIHTFGELCEVVIAKTNLKSQNISGPQHAFVKLKDAISSSQNIFKEEIQMETKLISLFPRQSRRKAIRELNFEMGFDLKVLRPFLIIEAFFILFFLGAIVELFFNLIYGLEAFAFLILLINLAFLTGKEFNVETVGALAEKIVKDKNRNPGKHLATFTNEEIIEELKFVFKEINPSVGEITNEMKIEKFNN